MIDPVSTPHNPPAPPQGAPPSAPAGSSFASQLPGHPAADAPPPPPPLPQRPPVIPSPAPPPETPDAAPRAEDDQEPGEDTSASDASSNSEATQHPAPANPDATDADAEEPTASGDEDDGSNAQDTANADGPAADSVESRFDSLSPEMKQLVAEIVAEVFRRLGFRAPPDPIRARSDTSAPPPQAPRSVQETPSARARRVLKHQQQTMIESSQAQVRALNAELRDQRTKTKTIVSRVNRGL